MIMKFIYYSEAVDFKGKYFLYIFKKIAINYVYIYIWILDFNFKYYIVNFDYRYIQV